MLAERFRTAGLGFRVWGGGLGFRDFGFNVLECRGWCGGRGAESKLAAASGSLKAYGIGDWGLCSGYSGVILG